MKTAPHSECAGPCSFRLLRHPRHRDETTDSGLRCVHYRRYHGTWTIGLRVRIGGARRARDAGDDESSGTRCEKTPKNMTTHCSTPLARVDFPCWSNASRAPPDRLKWNTVVVLRRIESQKDMRVGDPLHLTIQDIEPWQFQWAGESNSGVFKQRP